MNCTEFDNSLMDALAGELDEASRRAFDEHAAACAPCRDLLARFEATRAVAAEDAVALPAGFEERLLDRIRDAEGASTAASTGSGDERRGDTGAAVIDLVRRAGRWAMSPQFAMAATFLLVIGSSAMWLRKRTDAPAPASAVAVADGEEVAPASASLAPGEPMAQPARDEQAQSAAGFGRARAAATAAPAPPAVVAADDLAAPRGGALAQSAAGDPSHGAARGGGGASAPEAEKRASAATASPAAPSRSRAFDEGLAAYRAQRYAEATRTFDREAATGDDQAALWAARSVREGQGCATALPRFERLAARSKGTATGSDALLDSARCNRSLGNADRARDHYNRLLDDEAYAARARAELDSMGRAAAGPVHASPKRAATKTAPGTAGTTRSAAPVDRDDPFAGSSENKRPAY